MSSDLKSQAQEPYSDVVRQHFNEPAYAGDLPDGKGQVFTGQAGAIRQGAQAELCARVAGDRILAARFRAYGCPHLVAALDISCAMAEGKSVKNLADIKAVQLLEILQAPAEKTGRLLLVEDAIKSLILAMDN